MMCLLSLLFVAGVNWQVKPRSDSCCMSLSNLLILRGKDVASANPSAFCDPSIYSPLSSVTGSQLAVWSHSRVFGQREKSAVLLSNGQSTVVDSLERTVARAWNMFASRAYLHQYTSRGLDENDFVDCFAALEQTLADYRNLNGVT